jgi:membrane protein
MRSFGMGDWIALVWRVKSELATDHVGLIAAGVAFYGLLAIFPAITAILAISGLVLEPAQVVEQMQSLSSIVPDEAMRIITEQATSVAGSNEGGLGLTALGGLALALYSVSNGLGSLVEGMNIAFDRTETRGFIKRFFTMLALTVLVIIGLISGLFATVAIPMAISFINAGPLAEVAATAVAWIVLAAMTVGGLTILYRYGPCHPPSQVPWFNAGSMIACALWLTGSAFFAIYVANFGSYNQSFGALAGVIVLLTWLWLSAYLVLIGAEVNSEIASGDDSRKRQTNLPIGSEL